MLSAKAGSRYLNRAKPPRNAAKLKIKLYRYQWISGDSWWAMILAQPVEQRSHGIQQQPFPFAEHVDVVKTGVKKIPKVSSTSTMYLTSRKKRLAADTISPPR